MDNSSNRDPPEIELTDDMVAYIARMIRWEIKQVIAEHPQEYGRFRSEAQKRKEEDDDALNKGQTATTGAAATEEATKRKDNNKKRRPCTKQGPIGKIT